MRLATYAAIGLALSVSACAPAGYYDSNGQYRSYGKSDSFRHENAMAGTPDTPSGNMPEGGDGVVTETTTVYTHPGYYDHNGYYIEHGPSGVTVPRGMCRIWYADRDPAYQPAPESCSGIRYRVPVGAYVMYGGN